MQQRVKKIIEKLAVKYGLTFTEAEYAVKVYYEKIRTHLEAGNYPEEGTYHKVIIPAFGRFVPQINKIKKVHEHSQHKRIREHFGIQKFPDGNSTIPGIQDLGGEDNQTL